MRRILVAVALAAATIAALPGAANATTHSPCTYHYATPPSIDYVDAGTTHIHGAANVGGCPAPVGTESATVTATLQHLESGSWVDRGTSETSTRAWSRYTRGARQVSAISTGVCVPGQWRTHMTGADSAPFDLVSDVVTFAPGDSGVCGSYGGGD